MNFDKKIAQNRAVESFFSGWSSEINPLRPLAEKNPLTSEIIREACRVAKFRVVLKNRAGSPEFERLGFKIVTDSGKYSSFSFGVIEL